MSTPNLKAPVYTESEFLVSVLARMSDDAESFEIGNRMPIPASAALMVHARHGFRPRLSILGSHRHNRLFTGGILEQYDLCGRGLIDVQFFGGGQIDGQANINLVGVGGYPHSATRFAGSFGATLMYYTVRRTILFVQEHTKRVLVPKVEFISAAGVTDDEVFRNGGPIGLVTSRCVMSFDPKRRRFSLESIHPGHTLDEVLENTGFEFDYTDDVPVTQTPSAEELELLRTYVRTEVAEVYPTFADTAFGGEQEVER